jgi:hypothetical protein
VGAHAIGAVERSFKEGTDGRRLAVIAKTDGRDLRDPTVKTVIKTKAEQRP